MLLVVRVGGGKRGWGGRRCGLKPLLGIDTLRCEDGVLVNINVMPWSLRALRVPFSAFSIAPDACKVYKPTSLRITSG